MIRSPRAAAAGAPSQNASAVRRSSGRMKPTDPPLATVSIRISLKASTISGEARKALIAISDTELTRH